MEEDMITLKDQYGQEFQMIGDDGRFVSVLEGGYIITPDGLFVTVKDAENHSEIFSDYLSKYLNTPYQLYQSLEASMKLNQINHIAYFGVKTSDMKTMYGREHFYKSDGSKTPVEGFSLMYLPPLEMITDAQKSACLKLLETNHSRFRPEERLLDLQFGSAINNVEYSEEEIMNFLNTTKRK